MNKACLVGVATLWLLGCSGDDDLEAAKLVVFTGLEEDGWSAPPRVEAVKISREDLDGNREAYATLDAPTGAGNLSLDIDGATAFFEAEGLDGEGEAQLHGRSFLLQPEGLRGTEVGLFVGRKRRFGRPANLEIAPGEAPQLGILGGRFLISTTQTLSAATALTGYDFGLWSVTGTDEYTCPVPGSCAVLSLAVISGSAAVMVANDWASYTDFSSGVSGEYSLPNGLESFDEVAGGATVLTDTLAGYIAGPTREAATEVVLRISTEGELSVHRTGTVRARAAATYVDGRGLVIVGGSAEDAGVEVLADGSREFSALPFPTDDTVGAALVPFDGSWVLRVGGVTATGAPAPTVAYDLGCAEECAPIVHSAPVGLADAQAFRLEESVLVVGTDADEMTSARLIEDDGVTTIELRERRSHARSIKTYLGHVAVVGGTLESGSSAKSIELFTL